MGVIDTIPYIKPGPQMSWEQICRKGNQKLLSKEILRPVEMGMI